MKKQAAPRDFGPFKLTTEELLERLKSGDTRLESRLVDKVKRLLEPEL